MKLIGYFSSNSYKLKGYTTNFDEINWIFFYVINLSGYKVVTIYIQPYFLTHSPLNFFKIKKL